MRQRKENDMPKENFIELFLSVLGVVAAESLFYWILYCFDLGEHPLLTYGLTTVIFDAIFLFSMGYLSF